MLEQLKLVVPEIIVLDLALGKSDAVDVMRHLVELKFEGKILLISGRDESTLSKIHGIGERHGLSMLPSLRKPFRADELTRKAHPSTRATVEAPPIFVDFVKSRVVFFFRLRIGNLSEPVAILRNEL